MNEGNAGTIAQHFDEENRRLRAAFSVSLLMHVAILWIWWQPAVLQRVANQSAMTVSFLQSSVDFATSTPAEPIATETAAVLIRDKTDDTSFVARVKPPRAEPATAPALLHPQEVTRPDASLRENGPAPVVVHRPDLRIGEASIVMLVDLNGRPGEIYWNELPALTNEQLHLVELRIRQHRYEQARRGQTVTELINVFEILRGATAIRSVDLQTGNTAAAQDGVATSRSGAQGMQSLPAPTNQ